MDLLSAVDAIDERSRAHGVIEGLTDEMCEMRYTVRTDDIQPGDNLVSSGVGLIFSLAIFRSGSFQKSTAKKQFGITQHVEVRPSVDFTKLEEVMVVVKAENEALIPASITQTTEQKTEPKSATEKSPDKTEEKKP